MGNCFRFRVLAARLALIGLIQAAALSAEAVAVSHTEGLVHGFRTAHFGGHPLGIGVFRNVTDDVELKALVDKAREMLGGVSADDLRTTVGVRVKIQQGMADLATELDTMIVKKPSRKFRFNEE